MKLSAPVYKLKSQARVLAKAQNIPLSDALDTIAAQEGFKAWSLLSARLNASNTSSEVLSQVNPGDLLLIGARPGQGKTTMALQLVLRAALSGKTGWFFSLEWNLSDIHYRTRKTGINISQLGNRFQFDNSDDISAKYIISRIGSCLPGTVVAIDYLQLLDQDRHKPDVSTQIGLIKEYAKRRGIIFILISQIDRSYDLMDQQYPGIENIRLPNPLNLKLFDKACFISNGETTVTSIA